MRVGSRQRASVRVRCVAGLFVFALGAAVPVHGQGTSLPSSQLNQDIGSPRLGGAASYNAGTYTIKGSGADIGGTADQFQFVFQPIAGDFDVSVRVGSVSAKNTWAKVGVMARESLTADSTNAFALISAKRGYAFERRGLTGSTTDMTSGGNGAAPGWLRLVRSGSQFDAYRSTDGKTWTLMGTDVIQMADSVFVGMAVTSHSTQSMATAVLDTFVVKQAATPNAPPTVSLTAPAAGASFTAPATIALAAQASDPEGRLARVEFYAGSTKLATATTSPYTATWSSVAAGTYTLTAIAYDADGAQTTSPAVTVQVAPANTAPTVSLTAPATGTTYTAPATVTMNANAADSDGTVAKVEFYQGSTLLASDTASPYTWTWSSVAAGSYSLTAVAYDNSGAKTTSNAIAITVSSLNKPPTVSFTSPTNGATFSAPATVNLAATAADADGTVAKVEFYKNGTTLLGADTSAPYTWSWASVAAGTYSLTAVAYDNTGARTTSTAVSVTVNAVVSAPRAVQFQASADHATLVTSYRLDVFANGADPTTAIPITSANLGKPTPDANNNITVDESTLFTGLVPGTYLATVSAIGSGGTSRSTAVSFTR
jgi:regulation of enolase protein 1 (concanavalin A-like superfamily)